MNDGPREYVEPGPGGYLLTYREDVPLQQAPCHFFKMSPQTISDYWDVMSGLHNPDLREPDFNLQEAISFDFHASANLRSALVKGVLLGDGFLPGNPAIRWRPSRDWWEYSTLHLWLNTADGSSGPLTYIRVWRPGQYIHVPSGIGYRQDDPASMVALEASLSSARTPLLESGMTGVVELQQASAPQVQAKRGSLADAEKWFRNNPPLFRMQKDRVHAVMKATKCTYRTGEEADRLVNDPRVGKPRNSNA